MENKKLSTEQKVVRSIILVMLISCVWYFFPRHEAFHYDFELGKPWRYGRLSAPYDFAVYKSDSVVAQIEDSLRRQVTPRFVVDTAMLSQRLDDLDRIGASLPHHAYDRLHNQLHGLYNRGILQGDALDELRQSRHHDVIVRVGNDAEARPVDSLLSEKQAFEVLLLDTTYAYLHSRINLRAFVEPNLSPDTLMMQREYARIRQNVSSASGLVLAESRIVDRGEIITPQLYDILNSYRREEERRQSYSADKTLSTLGIILLAFLLLGSVLAYLQIFRPWINHSQKSTVLAIGGITLMMILTSLAASVSQPLAYMVPIGLLTIVLSTFLGSRTAFFCHVVMVLLCAGIASQPFEYIMVQIFVGMSIIFTLKDGLTERSQLMRVSLISMLVYFVGYIVVMLVRDGSLTNTTWFMFLLLAVNSILLLLSYLAIYALEKAFGFMSGVTLVELCNLGNKLLLKLSQEAPGTFQHSLQLGNITADAAKEIGANAQLVRTGALYHDIGKLWNPLYYTENQSGANPHDELTTENSVAIIKRHVSEGIKLAEKEGLPDDIVNFIRTHHGRTVIKYFYNTWCNAHPGEEPDAELFTYEGPDPETTEQALLMMGDGVEAASKSLQSYDEESISRLVNNIIDGLVSSGRLNNANISLRDIQRVKASFVRSLLAIYHARIAYPELNKSKQ